MAVERMVEKVVLRRYWYGGDDGAGKDGGEGDAVLLFWPKQQTLRSEQLRLKQFVIAQLCLLLQTGSKFSSCFEIRETSYWEL